MPEVDVEARLWCAACHAAPFLLTRVPVRPGSPVCQHVIKGINGAVDPPAGPAPRCPRCAGPLTRERRR